MSAPSDAQPGNGVDPQGTPPPAATEDHGTEATPVEPDITDSPDALRRKAAHNENVARNLQSRKDTLMREKGELEKRLESYGNLTPEQVQSLGGTDRLVAANTLAQMLQQSEKGQALILALQQGVSVDQALGGQAPNQPNGTSSDDDFYLSDEERRLRTENEALKQRLDRLEAGQSQQNAATGRQVLMGHLDTLFQGEFRQMPDELRQKMLDGVQKELDSNASLTSESTLNTLMSPQGLKTARLMLLSQLSGDEISTWGEQSYLRKKGALNAAATDRPSGERWGSDDPPLEIPKGMPTRQATKLAFEDAIRKYGPLSGDRSS